MQGLINHFRAGTMQLYGRDVEEPLLNHLKHLYQRVMEAGLSASELLGEAREELLEVEQRRAVLDVGQKKRSPRGLLRTASRCGQWPVERHPTTSAQLADRGVGVGAT